jgi:hypothetical protein
VIVHLFLPAGETDRALSLSTRFCPRAEKLNAREIFCVPADPGHRRELFAALAGEGFRVLAGAARSCLVARLASLALRRPSLPRRALAVESTPAGPLAVVPEGREAAFLAPLPVGLLWSVPAGLRAELMAHGLFTIGDVARVSVAALGRHFGPWGPLLADCARGEDHRTVRPWNPPPQVCRRWHGEIHGPEGLRAAIESVARSLAADLVSRRQGCRKLGLALEPVDGPTVTVTRCYRIPQAAAGALAARLLALAAPAAKLPLAGLTATAEELVPLKAEQLRLPAAPGERLLPPPAHPPEPAAAPPAETLRPEAARILAWLQNRYPDLTTAARLPRPRREAMLRFYDPWRSTAPY